MAYQLLSVAKSDALIIRNSEDATNALQITDLRDLLLLRARINAYIDTLQADGVIATLPPQPDEMITSSQARAEAAAKGHPVEESTLRMAMTRNVIPGAKKRGSRWYLPRRQFESWLQAHLHRQ